MNFSLSSGKVPDPFKSALVMPLLKKPNLDYNDLKNYRPIANLMFFAKIFEKVVSVQLRAYLQEHGLFPAMQSAYRSFHSTETALVKVMDDLLLAVDKGDEAILVMLDYSAAFETINHACLINTLQDTYGI